MKKYCQICNEPIHFQLGKVVLCSKPSCKVLYKATKNRIRKQRMKLEALKVGKECKRCHKRVHEEGMKSYCTDCRDILNNKKCKKCSVSIDRSKMYCDDCREEVRVKAIKKQTVVRKKKKMLEKLSPKKVIKSTIPEKFLVRGPISGGTRASVFA